MAPHGKKTSTLRQSERADSQSDFQGLISGKWKKNLPRFDSDSAWNGKEDEMQSTKPFLTDRPVSVMDFQASKHHTETILQPWKVITATVILSSVSGKQQI